MILKGLSVLAGLAIAASAVAVAATTVRHEPRRAGNPPGQVAGSQRLPRPRITMHPDPIESSTSASFRFVARSDLRFRCRLDSGRWRPCRSPQSYRSIPVGSHSFQVRTQARRGKRHGIPSSIRWLRAESRPFSVVPALANLDALFPGEPPKELPVRVENPNTIPIYVTGLRVSVSQDPPGCDSASNLVLTPASASDANPLQVPAGGSASVPSQGIAAPTIALLDLPVNQDACQGVSFPLSFSGSAHG